jgi:hypothetical protein
MQDITEIQKWKVVWRKLWGEVRLHNFANGWRSPSLRYNRATLLGGRGSIQAYQGHILLNFD